MTTAFPYFLQYEVRERPGSSSRGTLSQGLATVIVFAESGALAGARAGRHIGRNNWEIVAVKRGMAVRSHHVEHMDGVLKSLYKEAELAGIAAVFDGWATT